MDAVDELDDSNQDPNLEVSMVTAENEYDRLDFHPDEPRSNQFQYAVYFENIRHSLNCMLKIPIKKPFASNGLKLVI